MNVHHLNCGCMCPLGGSLYDGFSKGIKAHLVCHCLLLETKRNGLVLVDTGFGTQDVARPQRIALGFRLLNNIRFDASLTALARIRQLGFSASDVRHVVVTHLDFDHAGGLGDFPNARMHLLQAEHDTAHQVQTGLLRRHRFVPEQWKPVRDWCFHPSTGESWNGFQSVRPIAEEEDVLLVPLKGHTHGHAGVAVRSPDGWLLHAGDAYFHRGEIGSTKRHCTPGLRFYQRMMDTNHAERVQTQNHLRALSLANKELTIFCSHDAIELARCQETQQA